MLLLASPVLGCWCGAVGGGVGAACVGCVGAACVGCVGVVAGAPS